MNNPVGRFAPSPTGRMHLGNIFAALMSWLSVKSRGGDWILRIEDLDPQRSRPEYAKLIEEDLLWLGLQWDQGGTQDKGPHGPYSQSKRAHLYDDTLNKIKYRIYPCRCKRADLLAASAPHQADGRILYPGTCRPSSFPAPTINAPHSLRLALNCETIDFNDLTYGPQSVSLSQECGDYIIRRADGTFSYQFAVVTDDALMGVTEVVRGADLLLSAAQQIHLHELLGFTPPEYAHIPLLCAPDGRRLSKRDKDLSMEVLRTRFSPEQILGYLSEIIGIQSKPHPISARAMLEKFAWPKEKFSQSQSILITAHPEDLLK